MSYQQRPPMPMPMGGPMPPMMSPFGFPGPMMPSMGMNMMNPMMNRPFGPPPMGPNFGMMGMNNNKLQLEKFPSTKVFVGNINERVPDPMMRQMLQRCGTVLNWKRAEGPNGKLQAFGFCEYDNPQSTLRCIRLLNGYEIAEKKLLVKVDQKTRELLSDFLRKMRGDDKGPLSKNAKKAAALRNIPTKKSEDGEIDEEEASNNIINLELVDENTLKEDRVIIGALELILKQYSKDLNPPEPVPEVATPPTATAVVASTESSNSVITSDSIQETSSPSTSITPKPLDTPKKAIEAEEDQNKELKSPRDEKDRSNKLSERDQRDRDRDRERDKRPSDTTNTNGSSSSIRDRERRSARDSLSPHRSSYYTSRNHSRSPERDQSRETGKISRTHRSRSRSPDYTRSSRARKPSNERVSSSYRDSESNRVNSPARYSSRNTDVSSSSTLNKENKSSSSLIEDPEEERERKKLERKLREKEMAYRTRLKEWEEREEKKRRMHLSERKNEIQKRKIVLKEAKKLRQFMEDYEDEKDDSTYFKGSSLEKKLKFREKEIEADNRDRLREKEELDELKKKLAEKGLDDVEIEAKRIQDDEHLRMKLKFEKLEESSSSSDSDNDSDNEQTMDVQQSVTVENNKNIVVGHQEEQEKEKPSIQIMDTDSNIDQNEPKEVNNVPNIENFIDNSQIKQIVNVQSDESSSSPYNIGTNQSYQESPSTQEGYLNEIHKSNSEINMQVSNQERYPYSTPSSNSPIYFGNNNNTENSQSSLTTHVTIKTVTKKSIQPINQVFAEDEDASGPQFKRARFTSINESEYKSHLSSEERKKAVKKLVESIPTDRDELFSFKVDWDQLDDNLMEKRIKPWINKKIIEYIGEEEATLNDFICSKIKQRTKPEKLLEEVKVILDNEAELFIKKMWRLIVYETEAKKVLYQNK